MRKFVATAAVVFAGLVPFGGVASAAPAHHSQAQCSSSYTSARIGGVPKCLRRGEYCAVRYRSTYRHYGFTCSGNPARLH